MTNAEMKLQAAKRWARVAMIAALALGDARAVFATVGLTSRFADVVLENTKVGQVYNLRKEFNVPYTLKNHSESPTAVALEIVIPEQPELSPNYEAIPDPAWLKIVPNQATIPGNGSTFAEIILQVPDDPKYVGRHYQAAIWSHTSGEGLIGAGVKSRLRFSTGPGPDTLKAEKARKAMMTLDFDMLPQTLYVNDVEVGSAFDVREKTGKSIKVTNRAETPVGFTFASVPWDGRYQLEGFEPAPDPKWLTVEPGTLTLEGLMIKPLKMTLNIPDDKKQAGKKYAFLVKAQLTLGVEIEVVSRVFVTVK